MRLALSVFMAVGLIGAPLAAQSVLPLPRPTPEERAVGSTPETELPEDGELLSIAEPSREMTPEERARFIAQLSRCWNVGMLSAEAQTVAVAVAFTLTRDARPVMESIELRAASSDDPALAGSMFESVRRAIIRCGAQGYDLPAAAFSDWQHMEITFGPPNIGGN